jgi:hypothetical protein
MNISPDVVARATGLARQLGQSFLNAAVWRFVWSLPLLLVLAGAAVLFVLLVV